MNTTFNDGQGNLFDLTSTEAHAVVAVAAAMKSGRLKALAVLAFIAASEAREPLPKSHPSTESSPSHFSDLDALPLGQASRRQLIEKIAQIQTLTDFFAPEPGQPHRVPRSGP